MGATGSKKVNNLVMKNMGDYDPRFGNAIKSAAKQAHNEFPEIDEINYIVSKSNSQMGGATAGMNGLGVLELNNKYLQDWDSTASQVKAFSNGYFLSGDGTYEHSIVSHELGHNLDIKFSAFIMNHAPMQYEQPLVIKNDKWAEAYSDALGRTVKVGETVSDVPGIDSNTKFFKLDGKSYSYGDFSGKLSDIVVPLAIKNIQDNWKKFGYATKPTEKQLVSHLSGYAASYDTNHPAYHTEVFAEVYANHASYGKNANILAQEVMRLTKQAYNSVKSNPTNGVKEFYNKVFSHAKTDI